MKKNQQKKNKKKTQTNNNNNKKNHQPYSLYTKMLLCPTYLYLQASLVPCRPISRKKQYNVKYIVAFYNHLHTMGTLHAVRLATNRAQVLQLFCTSCKPSTLRIRLDFAITSQWPMSFEFLVTSVPVTIWLCSFFPNQLLCVLG